MPFCCCGWPGPSISPRCTLSPFDRDGMHCQTLGEGRVDPGNLERYRTRTGNSHPFGPDSPTVITRTDHAPCLHPHLPSLASLIIFLPKPKCLWNSCILVRQSPWNRRGTILSLRIPPRTWIASNSTVTLRPRCSEIRARFPACSTYSVPNSPSKRQVHVFERRLSQGGLSVAGLHPDSR